MDPTLKKRLDERLVAGEISSEEYQTIVNTLIMSNPRPVERAPEEDVITAQAGSSQPRRTKRKRTTKVSSPDDSARTHSQCPECGARLSPGVTYCSKCDHNLLPDAPLRINWRAVGLYFFLGFTSLHRTRVFDDGFMTGVWKLLIWPLLVLQRCVSG